MKKINGTKKIAIKVNSHNAEIYNSLAEVLSGSKKMLIEPGLTAYLLPDGTTMELYSAGAAHPDYLFAAANVVVSYKVAAFDSALARLRQSGAQLLGDVQQVCPSYRYCHLRLNGQLVLGIYEEC